MGGGGWGVRSRRNGCLLRIDCDALLSIMSRIKASGDEDSIFRA